MITRILVHASVPLLLAFAASKALADPGVHFAVGAMVLSNSTEQGGQGSKGSTVLTESEMTYHGSFWGLGAYFQYEKQGSNETDSAMGPKLELYWSSFYVEAGFALMMQRAFTDRSVEKQSGKGRVLGLGVRLPIGGAATTTTGGAFWQFTYKIRTQTVNKQDDVTLDDPITQTDSYPLFGIGYHL